MKRTGLAVFLSMITTVVGYAGLLNAHHPGLQSMGWLAIIGISTTLITAYFVLPALLEVFDRTGHFAAKAAAESAAEAAAEATAD
jgi:predicted RND superfamily exporter protein